MVWGETLVSVFLLSSSHLGVLGRHSVHGDVRVLRAGDTAELVGVALVRVLVPGGGVEVRGEWSPGGIGGPAHTRGGDTGGPDGVLVRGVCHVGGHTPIGEVL